MSTLYPIIRRVRRALLPPEDVAPVVAPVVVQSPTMVPSIETLAESAPVGAVEPAPVVVVATADQSLLTSAAMGKKATPHPGPLPDRGGEGGDDQSLLTSAAIGKKATPHPGPLPDRGGEGGDDQSLLTSAATKGMKGKQVSAKSRVKATDEAHSTQP